MEVIVLWKGPGPEEGLGSTDLPKPTARELLRAQGLCATQLGLGEKATELQPPLRKSGWGEVWGGFLKVWAPVFTPLLSPNQPVTGME